MKILKSILFGVMAMATLGGFTSCQDDVDAPEVQVPVATKKANTTIFDFKKEYWEDATNYCKKVGTKEDGSHIIVAGRVITSDEGGNIFKSITIQDETAALAFSVNTYNLFLDYRIGQEIVVDLTDMYVGKYNGLQQMGWPEEYPGQLRSHLHGTRILPRPHRAQWHARARQDYRPQSQLHLRYPLGG